MQVFFPKGAIFDVARPFALHLGKLGSCRGRAEIVPEVVETAPCGKREDRDDDGGLVALLFGNGSGRNTNRFLGSPVFEKHPILVRG